MSRSDGMTIEEQVMGAARSYLYGHAFAWDVPGRQGGVSRSGGSRARALAASLARRLSVAAPAEPAADPCACR